MLESLASGLDVGPILMVGAVFSEPIGNLHGPIVGAIKAVPFLLADNTDWSHLPR
jgi:hypothetical protein